MPELTLSSEHSHQVIGAVGGIPLRNIWMLILYASELFRELGHDKRAVEENPDDIPDLVGEILTFEVERRLLRQLTYGYVTRNAVQNRVRGHIDLLTTERQQLLERGKIACQYEYLTVNTPRNRYVLAAIRSISRIVTRFELKHRCQVLARNLTSLGVSGDKPGRAEISAFRYARFDSCDRFMVNAAHLAFDLALPTETGGDSMLVSPDRDLVWIRRLYEKAVGGFYSVVRSTKGWRVISGKSISWQVESKTAGIDRILPSMRTDIELEHYDTGKRIVIDTKFTSIVKSGWYREESLRSANIYQIYAYLRSQESVNDPFSANASGLLLYPSVGEMVDETVLVQGHAIRFATVDLAASAGEIRKRLLKLIE